MDEDFCEAHDLADVYPDKLDELIKLWWQEAGKYGVFPMLESQLSTRGGVQWGSMIRLKPLPPSQHFVYYAGMDMNAPVPRLKNKSFRLSAQVDYRSGDEGVLFACGFNVGGYVFYVQGGKLCFHYNFVASKFMEAKSSGFLPEGRHEFGFTFDFIEPGRGTGFVTVDGERAGEPVQFDDTGFMVKTCIGVGRYSTTAVNRAHGSRPEHFAYTGKYSRVELLTDTPETMQDRIDALSQHREEE